jgi:hypothetical protein
MKVSRNGTASTKGRASRLVRVCGGLCGLVLLALVLMAPAALAYPGPDPVNPVNPNVPTQVESNNIAVKSQSSGLAFTGGDVMGMVVIGGVLVGAGALTIRATRRRATALAS